MELQGKIIAALDERSGESARGAWKVQEFVLETHDTYPRKMVFSVFGADRLARFNIQTGQEVLVSFDIDAHEYNGRWYNSIRAYDVRPATQSVSATVSSGGQVSHGIPTDSTSSYSAPTQDPLAAQSISRTDSDEDLPF